MRVFFLRLLAHIVPQRWLCRYLPAPALHPAVPPTIHRQIKLRATDTAVLRWHTWWRNAVTSAEAAGLSHPHNVQVTRHTRRVRSAYMALFA